MALGDETPTTGRHRKPAKPSTRVDKETSIDMAQAFDVFTDEVRALNATMSNMRKDLRASLDAQARFSVNPARQKELKEARDRAGGADHPSETYDALAGIVRDTMAAQQWQDYHRRMGMEGPRGASSGPAFRYAVNPARPISGVEATQSLGHFQAWAAQRIGQRVAGRGRDVLDPSLRAPQRAPIDPTAGQPKTAPGPYEARHAGDPRYEGRHERPYEPRHGAEEEGVDESALGVGAAAAISGRLGSVLAQSGGTAAGLGVALKRIPYVGAVIEGVTRGRDFYLDQREQARGYQEMTGTTGFEGLLEARREDIHMLTNIFKYSGDRARAQFQTATALGYGQQSMQAMGNTYSGTRYEALDFMDDVYHNVGMDTDEAGQVLDLASRNTQTNVTRLARSLERLSESAGRAGINAVKARENFMQAFDFTTQRGYGPAAAASAEILTGTQISYGKTFEDTDFSGTMTQAQLMMIAGQQGISYGEAQGLLRNDPTAYMGAVSQNFESHLSNISPDLLSAIQSATEGENVSNVNVRNRIKDELIGPGGPLENADLETVAMAMSELTGIPMNREQLLDAAITEVSGEGISAQAEAQSEREASTQPGSLYEVAGRGGGSTAAMEALETDKTLGDMSPEERQQFLQEGFEELGVGTGDEGFANTKEERAVSRYRRRLLQNMGVYNMEGTELNSLGQAYASEYLDKGNQDPFLEELIKELGGQDAEVEITTADGSSQVMRLSQAISAGYGDLLATGNVRLVAEEYGGQTTSDVAGMQGREGPEAADMTQEELQEGQFGRPFEEWSEDYRGTPYGGFSGSQVTQGGVTIGLAPDAQRLFQFMNTDPNGAAVAGSPTDMGDLDNSRFPSEQPN